MLRLTTRLARRTTGVPASGRTGLLAVALTLALSAGAAGAQFVQVDAGEDHWLALRGDGTIAAWGAIWVASSGQLNVPALPPGLTYVDIAAGGTFSLARLSDGSVTAWGDGTSGVLNVPVLPPGLTCVEIAAGYDHALARLSDGSVVAWGDNANGECDVPALPPGLTYVQVSAGGWTATFDLSSCSGGSSTSYGAGHSVAVRSDGSVVAWGDDSYGQCDVPPLAPGLTYLEASAGGAHTAARLSDGSVVAFGDGQFGQLNVPALPPGVTFAGIDAGSCVTAARLSDGSFVTWGGAGSPWSLPAPPSGSTYSDVVVGGRFDFYHLYDTDPVFGCQPAPGYPSEWASTLPVALLDDGTLADWSGGSGGTVGNLGYGLAGSSGEPLLTGTLSPSPFGPPYIWLPLSNALPNSTTALVIGLSEIDLPFKGGTLVPSPDVLVFGLATNASGSLWLGDTLPPGIPPATTFYFQHWIVDPVGPQGLSASNALSVTTP